MAKKIVKGGVMTRSNKSKHTLIPIAGGIATALYFVMGLLYFETLAPYSLGNFSFYLPVFALFALSATALFFILFSQRQTWPLRRKFAVSTLFLVLAVFLSYLYAGLAHPAGYSWQLLADFFVHTALISLLPLIATLIYLQGQNRETEISEEPLLKPDFSIREERLFRIEKGPGRNAFKIPLDSLILVEAADNYCKIHYLNEGNKQMELLRTKMKEVEQAIGESDTFFRCHRSYLINGKKVLSISGVSQAYKLELPYGLEAVRVSRSFDLEPLRKLLKGNDSGSD